MLFLIVAGVLGHVIGLHTVFIPRENILFIPEYIAYHYHLGVEKFYLYDNRHVDILSQFDSHNSAARNGMVPGSINKQGLNFTQMINLTNEEIDATLKRIKSQYPQGTITMVDWQPRNEKGNVIYGQQAAIRDWIRKYGHEIDYGLHVDFDEFIVTPSFEKVIQDMQKRQITCLNLGQYSYPSRFRLIEKPILSFDLPHRELSMRGLKNFFDVKRSHKTSIHKCNSGASNADPRLIHFRHYRSKTVNDSCKPLSLNPDLMIQTFNELHEIGNSRWKIRHFVRNGIVLQEFPTAINGGWVHSP